MSAADDEGSYSKFSYLVRPSKQVERKLFVEALLRLARAGYHLSDYTYLGLGSPYFADFILFKKYLYIDRMICAEVDAIPKRMEFNLPYRGIHLHMGPVRDVGAGLDRKRRHFVWLDYDELLDRDKLDDCGTFVSMLPAGSIFVITVRAQPPYVGHLSPEELSSERDKLRLEFDFQFASVYSRAPQRSDVSRKGLPGYFANVIRARVQDQLATRPDGVTDFVQLFNYRYADGAQMLTVGGLIERPEARATLAQSGALDLPFVIPDTAAEPLEISVPPLTPRERLWFEQNLAQGPDKLEEEPERAFEMADEPIDNFRRYSRHYPNYIEALL